MHDTVYRFNYYRDILPCHYKTINFAECMKIYGTHIQKKCGQTQTTVEVCFYFVLDL